MMLLTRRQRQALALAIACAAAACGTGSRESAGGAAGSATDSAARSPQYRTWRTYGGGPDGIRYSALDQITRENVQRLEVAWSYDSGEPGGFQTNPIVVDDVVFANTPTHKVVALDAATGALRWRFDAGIKSQGPNRGVTYWSSRDEAGGSQPASAARPRGPAADARIFASVDHYVYALDARTGQPIPTFGQQGRIDLRENLGRPAAEQSIRLSTPGVIYKDLLIVGGRAGEGLPASPGDIRAYDVRTGALRWSFHTIPHPGEPGHETWPKDAWTYSGGANNWAGMAVDRQRGIVYAPTGSAAADFYGANRLGDNLFANSLLALDAGTGKRLWHFQAVRHDIWDRDFPSPPALVTMRHQGRAIDAVAQTSKHGYVFLFDRANGTPLFPLASHPFPPSPVDGERAAETQALPTKPAPFARQRLTADMLTTRTPGAHAAARDAFRTFSSDGQFVPLRLDRETVIFPGYDGGAEWGGSAFDPETGLLYVNANEMAWTGRLAPNVAGSRARDIYLRDCAACHRDNLRGAPPQIPSLAGVAARRTASDLTRIIQKGAGRMPGFPTLSPDAVASLVDYMRSGQSRDVEHAHDDPSSPAYVKYRFTGYNKFLDPDGYPAIAPPWGTLNAIDLHTGEHAWNVPLGEYPELAAQGVKTTGTENYGGPIVTAGGLVLIGATSFDRKFRAFDKATGALLWETTLPFAATGTPATYEVRGRQFIIVPAGGGKGRKSDPTGGMYIAFALPAPPAASPR